MTTDRTALLAAMQERFASLGLGYESLKVFGVLRINVHVICVSRTTAQQWVRALSAVFPGVKIACVPHVWAAVENKGTCLNQTMRRGFLIGVAA